MSIKDVNMSLHDLKMSIQNARLLENKLLDTDSTKKRDYRNFQSVEQKEKRLSKMSEYVKRKRENETEIQREVRKENDRLSQKPGMRHTCLTFRRKVVSRVDRMSTTDKDNSNNVALLSRQKTREEGPAEKARIINLVQGHYDSIND